jgi:hypothetical protein
MTITELALANIRNAMLSTKNLENRLDQAQAQLLKTALRIRRERDEFEHRNLVAREHLVGLIVALPKYPGIEKYSLRTIMDDLHEIDRLLSGKEMT